MFLLVVAREPETAHRTTTPIQPLPARADLASQVAMPLPAPLPPPEGFPSLPRPSAPANDEKPWELEAWQGSACGQLITGLRRELLPSAQAASCSCQPSAPDQPRACLA